MSTFQHACVVCMLIFVCRAENTEQEFQIGWEVGGSSSKSVVPNLHITWHKIVDWQNRIKMPVFQMNLCIDLHNHSKKNKHDSQNSV